MKRGIAPRALLSSASGKTLDGITPDRTNSFDRSHTQVDWGMGLRLGTIGCAWDSYCGIALATSPLCPIIGETTITWDISTTLIFPTASVGLSSQRGTSSAALGVYSLIWRWEKTHLLVLIYSGHR